VPLEAFKLSAFIPTRSNRSRWTNYLRLLAFVLILPAPASNSSEIYKNYDFPDFQNIDSYQRELAAIPEMREATLAFEKNGNDLGAWLSINEDRVDYLAISLIIVLYDKNNNVLSAARYPFIFSKCSDLIFADGKPYSLRFEFGTVEEEVDHFLFSYKTSQDRLRGIACASK
jgi:hypothetical protein